TPLLAPVVPILGRGLIPTVGEGGGPDGHRWCPLAVPGQVLTRRVTERPGAADVDAVLGAPGGELFGGVGECGLEVEGVGQVDAAGDGGEAGQGGAVQVDLDVAGLAAFLG